MFAKELIKTKKENSFDKSEINLNNFYNSVDIKNKI